MREPLVGPHARSSGTASGSPAAPDPASGTDSPWPDGARFGSAGLTLSGVHAEELAARYGTPLLVVDEEHVRSRCREVRTAFPGVAYATKALTTRTLMQLVVSEGLDLLVSSEGELEAAVRAGVRGDRIILHGNNKSDRELAAAVAHRVGLVIVDNPAEIDRLAQEASAGEREQPVLLRVLPEVEARTHPAIATGARGSKFGTPLAGVGDAVAAIRERSSLRFRGLHAHIGSQVLDVAPYFAALDTLLDLIEELRDRLGVRVEVLDVGGGFGVTATAETALPVPELAGTLLSRLEDGASARGLPVPTLVAEPGRSLVANAGVTLYRTGTTKRSAETAPLVAVDGGMSDNIRPMLYGAQLVVAPASPTRPGPSERVTLVGRHCESGDVLATDLELPAELAEGSLLAVAATGAYTYSMASTYNRVGRPAIVGVRDGRSHVWVRREDAADMDRLEAGPAGPIPEYAPPAGVTIRPARPRDAASFLAMWESVVAEGVHVRTEHVRGSLRSYRRRFRGAWGDREVWLMALEGERVVGNLHIQREDHPVTRHVATLGIAIALDRRGRGIGAALMSEALRWAAARGVEKVELSVYPTNAAGIALYRRFGFVEEGRLVKQSRKAHGYEDEILMARWIGPEGPRTAGQPER